MPQLWGLFRVICVYLILSLLRVFQWFKWIMSQILSFLIFSYSSFWSFFLTIFSVSRHCSFVLIIVLVFLFFSIQKEVSFLGTYLFPNHPWSLFFSTILLFIIYLLFLFLLIFYIIIAYRDSLFSIQFFVILSSHVCIYSLSSLGMYLYNWFWGRLDKTTLQLIKMLLIKNTLSRLWRALGKGKSKGSLHRPPSTATCRKELYSIFTLIQFIDRHHIVSEGRTNWISFIEEADAVVQLRHEFQNLTHVGFGPWTAKQLLKSSENAEVAYKS